MSDGTTRLLYFSWIRERVGMEQEILTLPTTLNTVGDLLAWMAQRNEQFAYALERPEIIRVALDQEHADHEQPIGSPREIALFPPMTGG